MTTDRERDDQRTTLVLAADTALTSAERATFLKRLRAQDGAHVADVLADMDNRDAFLEVVEPMYELHAKDVPEPQLLAVATYLAIGIHGFEPLASWELVAALVERIRPLLGMDTWELRDARAKRDKLELLAPLGFVDADDGERTDHIWHPAFGNVSYRYVSFANVVELALKRGKDAGADELRAQFRALMKVSAILPPTDDGN